MLRVVRLGALAPVLVLLTACGADPTPTTVAERPGLAATQTANNQSCAGIQLYAVQLDMQGLPYPWQTNCVAATPYTASQPPGPTGLPQHVEINFGNVNPQNVKPGEPIIYIIPVAAYEQLWNDNNNPAVSNTLGQLNTLLKDKPEPIPTSGMPVLPYEQVTGHNDLSVQGKYLTVRSGSGVRFVGRFAQSPVPVSNDNPQLMYIYQGYSTDGTYFVSFFYPVSTSALPQSTAVTEAERQQVDANSTAYMQAEAQQLNALPDSAWNPPLTQLDAVINSLRLGQ